VAKLLEINGKIVVTGLGWVERSGKPGLDAAGRAVGDSAEMISARARFPGTWHYSPLAHALVDLTRACPIPGNLLIEALILTRSQQSPEDLNRIFSWSRTSPRQWPNRNRSRKSRHNRPHIAAADRIATLQEE
jgi:hypothetical protein